MLFFCDEPDRRRLRSIYRLMAARVESAFPLLFRLDGAFTGLAEEPAGACEIAASGFRS